MDDKQTNTQTLELCQMYHGKGWTASFCDPVLILKLSSIAYHLKPDTRWAHSLLCMSQFKMFVPLARCLLDLAEFKHNTFKLKKWVIRLEDIRVILFIRMERLWAVGGPVSKIYIRLSEKRHGHSERIRQSEELHVEKHGDIWAKSTQTTQERET